MSGSGLTSDAFGASKSRGGPIGRIDLHPAGGASPNRDRLRAGAPKIPSHSRAYGRRAATSQFDRTGCSKPRWSDRRARNQANWTETSNRSNESGNGEVIMASGSGSKALAGKGDLPLSIEEKYDEVRQLISIGKEKGYLLYDEVNELLPADITSSDELDDLFSTFGSAGIEVVDSEQKYREDKLLDRTGEGAEELELDLTPGALDKTNDPVRMYLREMGTVPLLTREGEVEIAKRIERGKLAVIKSISRTPTIARLIMQMGDALRNDERSIRELVTFVDEELTDEKIDDRKKQVLRQIDAVRKAWLASEKCKEKLENTAKGATSKDKRKYRRVRWESMRAQVEVSQLIRKIEFTETIKRRMIGQIKDKVEAVMRFQRQIAYIERQLTAKNRRPKLKEEEKKNLVKQQKDLRVQVNTMAAELEEKPEQLMRTLETISRGEAQAEQAKMEQVEHNH